MTSALSRRECLALPLLALAPACAREKAAAKSEALTLRFGFIGTGELQPVGAEGFSFARGALGTALAKLGFQKPHFVRFANGPDLNEALSGGSLDIGIYGDTPALVGRAAGLPTRLVNQTVVGMDAWLLTRAGGARSLGELAGKVVATSKGSYMHRYLVGLLAEQGLRDRVTLVHLLPSDAQAALERGDVAAYAAPVPTAPLFVKKGAAVLDRASAHRGLVGSSVTVVTEAFLEKHPTFPASWNELRKQAVAELARDPEGYYRFHAETVRLPLEVVKEGYPLSLFNAEPLVPEGRALLEGTKRFLVEQGLAQRDFDLGAWAVASAPK